MKWSHHFWPLSIIAIGIAFTIWLWLSAPYSNSLAQPSCNDQPLYPGCYEPALECEPYPDICNPTKTAAAQTRTALVATALTATARSQGQTNQSPAATATPTLTATETATPLTTLVSPTATLTPLPVATSTTQTSLPSPTLLPTATPTLNFSPTPTTQAALRCAPGDLVELSGKARPHIALLVLFDDRPVGGGASDQTGTFRIVLRIGAERPGQHEIVVQERERAVVVAEYLCETPLPPTPTATLGPLRVTTPGAP
jgi:hypothetical protein